MGTDGAEDARVAVLDIGKTNVKLSVANARGRIVETVATPNPTIDGPPWRHHDLKGLGDWVLTELAALAGRYPLERLITAAHGSGAVLVTADPDAGGDGAALPMIDYEGPLPTEIASSYEALAGDFADRGSAMMMASTHLARQLYRMEMEQPDAVAGARWFLGLPQYWAWRFCGRAVSEATILGAQSHLWNVAAKRWSRIVTTRGWERLMPPFARAYQDLGPLRPTLAARHRLPTDLRVHAGVHDSSANAYRYRAAGLSDAMIVSTGTWIVALAGGIPFERLNEHRGMTLNADVFGDAVGGALTMGGRTFAILSGEQPNGATADPAVVARLIARGTMALPSFTDDDGQFPGTALKGQVVGPPPADADERRALAVLTVALLTVACIDRLDAARPVVLDGSLLADPLTARLVAALRPGLTTLFNRESYGVAAGAALLAGHDGRTGPEALSLHTPDPIDAPGLSAYAAAWRRAAEEGVDPRLQE